MFAANINGRKLSLTVVGIALSPEFIYVIAPGEIVPDDARYGVIWIERKALAAVTDTSGAFNDVLMTMAPGASERDTLAAIDALLEPYGGTGAYGRSQQMSHSFLDSEFGQLSTMAGVIPEVFLLVASFLVYSVIARQIETQREEIGILKAFGYADFAVAWHFIKMALATAVIGLLLGWAAGSWLAGLITDLYRQYFKFPNLVLRDFIRRAGALGARGACRRLGWRAGGRCPRHEAVARGRHVAPRTRGLWPGACSSGWACSGASARPVS
jgi:putative ABC transport system permease protein